MVALKQHRITYKNCSKLLILTQLKHLKVISSGTWICLATGTV